MTIIREDLVTPILAAIDTPQERKLDIDDLDSIIESAMQLGASIAKQKAEWEFEFIPPKAYGEVEFSSGSMKHPSSFPKMDSRLEKRAVVLTLAPRLLKHGTGKETGFDSFVGVLDTEVETKVMMKNERKLLYNIVKFYPSHRS